MARNATTGPALAEAYGYSWVAATDELGGDLGGDLGDDQGAALLVNVTPVGMAGGPAAHESPFTGAQGASAAALLDVVAVPSETPLVRLARGLGKPVVTGAEVIALQAAEQFRLYTGVRPSAATRGYVSLLQKRKK